MNPTSAEIHIGSHADLRVPELVGCLPRGQSLVVEDRRHRLPERVSGHPLQVECCANLAPPTLHGLGVQDCSGPRLEHIRRVLTPPLEHVDGELWEREHTSVAGLGLGEILAHQTLSADADDLPGHGCRLGVEVDVLVGADREELADAAAGCGEQGDDVGHVVGGTEFGDGRDMSVRGLLPAVDLVLRQNDRAWHLRGPEISK